MVDLGLYIATVMLRRIYVTSYRARPVHTPEVTLANREKSTLETMSAYLRVFFSSTAAAAAADPARILMVCT